MPKMKAGKQHEKMDNPAQSKSTESKPKQTKANGSKKSKCFFCFVK